VGSPALSDERTRAGKSVIETTPWAKAEPLCFERAAQLPAERISNIRAIRWRPRSACLSRTRWSGQSPRLPRRSFSEGGRTQ